MGLVTSDVSRKEEQKKEYKYRLFCLPYAGTGASLYAGWSDFVDKEIEICALQLPGRESRRREVLCKDCGDIVNEICESIYDKLDKPFAVFGYSMGGIIAYELSRQIYIRFNKKPVKLFMSASSTFRDRGRAKVSQMDEKELMLYLEKSGGISESILSDKRFRDEYFPVIRNDYALVEDYRFNYKRVPCDIIAIASAEDKEVSYSDIRLLRFFTGRFQLFDMPGNHFFIRKRARQICELVSKSITGF